MWKLGAALTCAAILALPVAASAAGQPISVNGTGGVAVPDGATNAQQQSAYGQALAAAIADAQTKALIVAQHLSLALGPVQSFTEQSGEYLGYCGIGFLPGAASAAPVRASAPAAAGATSGHLTPIAAKHKKHKRRKHAHKAQSDNTCQIEAAVTVIFAAA